jgi:methylmalonyl-CoA mutase
VTGAIKGLAAMGFKSPLAAADGRVVHDAGGSEGQELAFVLAAGIAYLRAIEAAGIALEDARGMVYARLAADADQFLTLAKFRALRLLWARVEQACGLAPKPLFIAADTSWRMLTQRDAFVNMLRATMATFSAGLGGANAIAVLPHTLALGLPDPFARRVARNTQLVLLEESNLAKVSDPAAGSGGIETLTRELCDAAWALFQETEKAGGLFAALEQNIIQRKVAATRAAREANIAKRRDVLTGASEFPNLQEADIAVLDAKPIVLAAYGEAKYKFDPMPPMRLAAPFEVLRDRSDAIKKKTGARPKVFLANLGTAADFTARATYAKSFFETGGIEAVDSDGAADPAKPRRRVQDSGAKLACLCSSDKGVCRIGRCGSRGPSRRRRKTYLSGGPPRRVGGGPAKCRRFQLVFAGGDALGGAAGRLAADGASMSEAAKPVLTGGCQCGAVRFAVSKPPSRISICHCRMCQKGHRRAVCLLRRYRACRFQLDARQAVGIPILLDRAARFLRRLRHPAELPPHRRTKNRDPDRQFRPARPGDSDAAIWHRIPPRLGGGDRQSAEPDHAAELRAGEDGDHHQPSASRP